MAEITQFFLDAGYLGGGSVFLALILFGVSYFEHRQNKNVWAGWLAVVGMLAFCLGSYMAWRTERDNYNVEHEARLKAEGDGKPHIEAAITMASEGPNQFGQVALTLGVDVVNRGAPSIVAVGKLAVTKADGSDIPMLIHPPSETDVTLHAHGTNPGMVLLHEDYFGNKAMSNPIPKGGAVYGWMMFICPDRKVTLKDIEGARVTLSFYDVDKNMVTASQVIGANTAPFYNPRSPYAKPQ